MMNSRLRLSNGAPIQPVTDESFRPYGRVLAGYDFTDADRYLKQDAEMPPAGNVYKASDSHLEALPLYTSLAQNPFGLVDIQLGYCNGNTHQLNAIEWHKCAEVNYAATDMVLLLALFDELENDTLSSTVVRAFFVPAGTAVELLPNTLHFAPCAVLGQGFRCMVALPRGTNSIPEEGLPGNMPLLRAVNKWLICHPDRHDLIQAGVCPGIMGENIEVLFD